MYYIYALSSVENPDNYRYIGLTNNLRARFNRHLLDSELKGHTRKIHWIKSVNKEIILTVLQSGLETRSIAGQMEIIYIKLLKFAGYDLTNGTDGGDGGSTNLGHKFSDEHNKKLSEYHITHGTIPPSRKGAILSNETKLKLSKAIMSLEKLECPHCGKVTVYTMAKVYHFDNCKFKPDLAKD